ncbi:MAG: ABC transporter permease [Blastocatellia bacterium]|nr:ABC transporter permease [Blastocatellia bacterium]
METFEDKNLAGGAEAYRKRLVGLGFVFLLVISLIALHWSARTEYFSSIGLIVFLVLFISLTAYAVWSVRTSSSNSLWADAWKRLFKNKLAVFGLIVVWLMVLLVAVGPTLVYWLNGFTPDYIPSGVDGGDRVRSFPPSGMHPMGTDDQGRDLLARVLQGGRISLMVGIISTFVSLIVGVSWGAVAGYLGGRVDNIMMRIVDIIYSIPYILVVIVLLSVLGGPNTGFLIGLIPAIVTTFITLLVLTYFLAKLYQFINEYFVRRVGSGMIKLLMVLFALVTGMVLIEAIVFNMWMHEAFLGNLGDWMAEIYMANVNQGLSQIFLLFFALGLVSWLTMARVVRGQILSLKNQEFVLAAKATGVSTFGIIFRHLVPNALGPVIVYATLTVPSVMLTEAFLSFLGLGVQAPYASWGSLASDGIKNIQIFPWQLIFPGVTMALTLFSLNFLGDGLRDALDPQTRKF